MPRNCWTRCNKTFPCSFLTREKTREIESRETSRRLEKQAISALLRKMICKMQIYVITAAIAICLVVLFNKKVLAGKSKAKYTFVLVASIIVIIFSVGLRIVYETKVDSVTAQFPLSGSVKVIMTTHTDYYNATGVGFVRNPSTNIWISEKRYDSGSIIEVDLNQKYSMRVGAGGSEGSDYIDTSITFTNTSFKNGQYTVTKEVRITSGPASMAEVQLIFNRYCTFWEVIFG